jgi:hypothetical protein
MFTTNVAGFKPIPRRLRFAVWRWGAIATFTLPLGLAMAVSQGGLSLAFPDCWFQRLFGFPAPSCGLTRSFLALARGDWPTALEYHLFGPLLAGVFAAIALMAAWELITQRSRLGFYQRLFYPPATFTFVALLLSYYGLRLWARYTHPHLPWGWEETMIWQRFLAGALAL